MKTRPGDLELFQLRPHPRGDVVLLFAQGIGVDRRDLQGGMPHPLGEHVERHPASNRMDTVAMAQALGALVGAVGDARCVHHLLDPAEGCRSRPGP